jgi:Glycosyltransferase family 87
VNRTWLLAACVLLAATLLAYPTRVSKNMRDFEVWWTAAGRAAAAEPLYRAEDEHYQFKYLPAFAELAIPLGLVPLRVAKPLWFGLSVAQMVALIALSLRLLPQRRKSTAVLVASAILAVGRYYPRELDLGQVNLIFAVAATGALVAVKARRDILAAALFVSTVAIKPYGVLLLPLVLMRHERAIVVATGIGMALLFLLPIPLYGLAGTIGLHQSWWQTIIGSTTPNLLSIDNVSVASMYAKWIGAGQLSVVLTTATTFALTGIAALVFFRRRSVPFPEGLEGSLLLLLIPLVSPQGWDYVLLLATPGVMYLANYLDTMTVPWRVLTVIAGLTIGLSFWDIIGREAYAVFMGAAVISVCALILVAALCTLRLRSVA